MTLDARAIARNTVEAILQNRDAPIDVDASKIFVPDIVEWGQEYYFLPETRRPIELEWHQKDILEAFTERLENGRFRWTTLLYSTIKKSGKTAINGMYCQWAAETWGQFQEVYTTGNKLEQAQERAFAKVIASLTLSGRGSTKEADGLPWYIQKKKLTYEPNSSFIKAIPVAAEGEAGANQSLTSWTELWGYTHEFAEQFYTEMQPVPTRPLSQRFIDTYAGYSNESELLEGIWKLGEKGEKLHPDLPLFGNEDAGLIAYIDQGLEARRMSWQLGKIGEAYYRQAEAQEKPHQYERIHLNRWVSSINAFVPMPIWDSLVYAKKPKPIWVVVSIDASRKNDCTALVVVCRIGDIIYELDTVIWTPDAEHEMDYQLTVVPTIEALMETYTIAHITYDPWQLADTMMQLSKEKKYRNIPIEEFDQGKPRVEADTALEYRITQGTLLHSGHEGLRQHVQNADAKDVGVDKKAIRIIKREDEKKIDAVIALSMGAQVATEIAGDWKPPVKVKAKMKASKTSGW